MSRGGAQEAGRPVVEAGLDEGGDELAEVGAVTNPQTVTWTQDYPRMAEAIRWIAEHRLEQPGLDEVAAAMRLSPTHAQRVFTRWAGLSPKRFLGLLTVEHAKGLLRERESVMGAAFEVGLSGGSRLHDLFLQFEAMTPGDYKREGAGLELRWGVQPTPFGLALLVVSDRGLCRLAFLDEGTVEAALDEAKADWPLSRFVADPDATRAVALRCFADGPVDRPLALLVKGTEFQIQVWRALLQIPEAGTLSYGALAQSIGRPGAARAVGAACRMNRLALVIPCHRVIREAGELSGYRWGADRKRAILARERARRVQGGDQLAA